MPDSPEIDILVDDNEAIKNLRIDDTIRRMILWASRDKTVQEIEIDDQLSIETFQISAGHISVIVNSNAIAMIENFLYD